MFIKKSTFNQIQEQSAQILKQNKTLEKYLGVFTEQLQEYNIATQTGSAYTNRSSQVLEVRKKHKGEAVYGNMIAQRLIDLRVAFSVPNRLFLITNSQSEGVSQAEECKKFLEDFMSLNGLDQEVPRDFAKEAELHGQVLVQIVWDPKAKLPRLKYFPWGDTKYTVEGTSKFLLKPRLKSTFSHDGRNYDFNDDEICFIAFHDELNKFEGRPTCGGILKTIENLDKDLQDWRRLNHLFAHPTPHFKCESAEEATAVRELLSETGWRVGTALATSAELALKGTTGAEANVLMLSIQTGAKIISAHTGIGIHFLGFANVMSNRATADSMGEPTEVVLHSEITSWQSFYNSMCERAIRLRNRMLNRELPEDAVRPRLVPMTDRQWSVLKTFFMPAAEKNLISHETMLSRIPDLDPEVEMAKIKEEEKIRESNKQADFDREMQLKEKENGVNNGDSTENKDTSGGSDTEGKAESKRLPTHTA